MTESRSVRFPQYLKPGPDKTLSKWLGRKLRSLRGQKDLKNIAESANVTSATLKELERGLFHLNLGQLRDIVRYGYSTTLEDMLCDCFNAHKHRFDPAGERPFERDYHYSLSLADSEDGSATPLFIGGVPDSYLWGVPIRRLKNQPLATEFLELAPARKRKSSGVTPNNSHSGVEVLHVIFGRVEAHINSGGEARYKRPLKKNDSIHFCARHPHKIENLENGTPALLLVVRLPET